jgi:hypothetical protein
MINFSTFLLESRLDYLKQQNPEIDSSHDSLVIHRSTSDIIDHFANKADPTSSKKQTQWIVGRIRAIEHPNSTSKHISMALVKEEPSLRRVAIRSQKISDHDLGRVICGGGYHSGHKDIGWALDNPKINDKHLNMILQKDPSDITYINVMNHRAASPALLDHGLDHPDSTVRETAAYGRNASSENLHKALKDKVLNVRQMAIRNKNIDASHLSVALKDPHETIRFSAIRHPKIAEDHIATALNDPDNRVSSYAAALRDGYTRNK